jgi:hypothetical protein
MALDKSQVNSLFGGAKGAPHKNSHIDEKGENQNSIEHQEDPVEELESEDSSQPKYDTLDKVTVLLKPEHKEALDRAAKKILRYRSKKLKGSSDKERITANTLIRCLVEIFLCAESKGEMEILRSEKEAQAWVSKTLERYLSKTP